MARYSTFAYGQYKYGGGRGLTRSSILAQIIDYSKIAVTFEVSSRQGKDYLLVRTYNGAAEHPLAGLIVSSGTVAQTEYSITDGVDNYLDSNTLNDIALYPGWVYYTLFIIDSDKTWIKDAATSILLPYDRGTLDYLMKALPSVYTAADGNPITPHEDDSPLMRFLSTMVVTYDELAAHVDSVLPDVRGKGTIRRLHDAYANAIGMPSEYTIGVASTARLHREGGYIYRNKGTTSGISSYVEALTGWQTTVSESPNLFLSINDASFEGATSNWGISGGTLTPTTVDGGSVTSASSLFTYNATVGAFKTAKVGAVALTSSSATLTLPGTTNVLKSIPVTAGDRYFLTVPVRATAGTPTVTASIIWRTQDGTSISTSTGAAWSTSSTWTQNLMWADAPATAKFVTIQLVVSGSSGNTIHLDMLSFRRTQATDIRSNLVTNPSVETNTTNWSLNGTGTTIARITSDYYVGSASLEVTKGAVTNAGATFGGTTRIAVSASTTYTVSAYVKVPTSNASSDLRLRVSPYDALAGGSALASTASSTTTVTSAMGWVRLSYTFTTPVNSAGLTIRVEQATAGTAGEKFLIDGVLLETGSSLLTYFDGANNGYWSGTAHASSSYSDENNARLLYRDPRSVTVVCQPSRVNLIKNPTIDTNASFWSSTGTSAFARSTASAYIGIASLLATSNGSALTVTPDARIPVLPNQPYVWSMYVKAGTSTVQFRSNIQWYDAQTNGTLLSTATGTATTVTSSGWTRVTVTGTAPATATYALPVIASVSNPTSGHTTYLDAAVFEQTDYSPVFFSGSVADSSGTDSVWSGTAANSYSLLYPSRLVKLARLRDTLDYYVPNGVTWRVLLWDSNDPEVQAQIPYGTGVAV